MMKTRPGCIIKKLKLKTTLGMKRVHLLKIERLKAGNQGLATQSRLRVQDKIGTTMESCSRSFIQYGPGWESLSIQQPQHLMN